MSIHSSFSFSGISEYVCARKQCDLIFLLNTKHLELRALFALTQPYIYVYIGRNRIFNFSNDGNNLEYLDTLVMVDEICIMNIFYANICKTAFRNMDKKLYVTNLCKSCQKQSF